MQVKTNTGAVVDLSQPENIRAGMVFEDDEGLNRMTVGDGSHEEQGQREAAGLFAYRRAVVPHKAPPPERKTRGPRLVVDRGDE